MKAFYAVVVGREVGIFTEWEVAKTKVPGFKGPVFKGFNTLDEAKSYYEAESVKLSRPMAYPISSQSIYQPHHDTEPDTTGSSTTTATTANSDFCPQPQLASDLRPQPPDEDDIVQAFAALDISLQAVKAVSSLAKRIVHGRR